VDVGAEVALPEGGHADFKHTSPGAACNSCELTADERGMDGVYNHGVHVGTKKSPSGETGLHLMFREEQKEGDIMPHCKNW
jgi:hypothetical protein